MTSWLSIGICKPTERWRQNFDWVCKSNCQQQPGEGSIANKAIKPTKLGFASGSNRATNRVGVSSRLVVVIAVAAAVELAAQTGSRQPDAPENQDRANIFTRRLANPNPNPTKQNGNNRATCSLVRLRSPGSAAEPSQNKSEQAS